MPPQIQLTPACTPLLAFPPQQRSGGGVDLWGEENKDGVPAVKCLPSEERIRKRGVPRR